jgi:hypothetical protein
VNFENLNIITPKRVRRRPSGWDVFFPYYAGYPITFASKILQSAPLKPGARIFDPWNGSGTTTAAAIELGLTGIGVDLNPVMVVISRARLLQSAEADVLAPLAKEIVAQAASSGFVAVPNEPLAAWFDDDTSAAIRGVEAVIRKFLVGALTLPSQGGSLDQISPVAATLYVALFVVCRDLSIVFRSSNPTWLKMPRVPGDRQGMCPNEIYRLYQEVVDRMALSLECLFDKANEGSVHASLHLGDSVDKSVDDRSIDFVLTSPPYCTRLDYTSATRIELAILHSLLKDDVPALSRQMIGSIRVPNRKVDRQDSWGPKCHSLLDQIKCHPSKASSGYYYKTNLDYFDKMARSIGRISDALKEDGCAVMVVQDSYYKEVHNDLPAIVTEIGELTGLRLGRRDDFIIRTTLAATHAHASKYVRPRGAVETVLCFQKS